MRITALMCAGLLMLGACATEESAEPTTTAEVTTTATPETTTTAVTVSTTPRPDAAQAAAIEAGVAVIYPGVPEGKAADWARETCSDILRGVDPVRNAQLRFAGGTRPDPTPEQAQAIVDLVRNGGWCS